jgi:hypothetical protein
MIDNGFAQLKVGDNCKIFLFLATGKHVHGKNQYEDCGFLKESGHTTYNGVW